MAKIITDSKKINELLERGVEEALVREHLEKRLKSGDRLKVKLGIDPSGSLLHLGHAVVLRKLRAFQELGHEIILIVGSFTGMIGDPTGKTTIRKPLTYAEVRKNFTTYKAQAGKIIDISKTKVFYNHKWLSKLKFDEILEAAGAFTVSQMLDRDMYKERMQKNLPISLPEFFYPLMQGYDSVYVKADVEIGASDQLFNILAGRTLAKHLGKKEQDLVITPLLLGTDGVKKMGKSEGNFIALTSEPSDMYGKVMSIPDSLIAHYFELATDVEEEELKRIKSVLEKKDVNPRDVKMRLAREIVKIYHGDRASKDAEASFKKVFQERSTPGNMPVKKVLFLKGTLENLVASSGIVSSKSEARRVILERGIKLNGAVKTDPKEIIEISGNGVVIQKGKRHFIKLETK